MQIKKNLVLVAVAAIVLTSGGTAAVAGSLISSNDIKDETIKSEDIKDNGVKARDLADGLLAKVTDGAVGATGPAGKDGLDGAQGPKGDPGAPGQAGKDGKDGKDGVTNLITGAGYTDVWEAGSYGESLSECPEGQYALGGGYSTWGGFNGTNDGYDLGGTNLDIQVTVNAPYFAGEYVPVDDAGNFRADQWVVRGFNHGTTDQIVRAWVNCATVN